MAKTVGWLAGFSASRPKRAARKSMREQQNPVHIPGFVSHFCRNGCFGRNLAKSGQNGRFRTQKWPVWPLLPAFPKLFVIVKRPGDCRPSRGQVAIKAGNIGEKHRKNGVFTPHFWADGGRKRLPTGPRLVLFSFRAARRENSCFSQKSPMGGGLAS